MAEHRVSIKGMKYNPDPVVIAAGDLVYWVNEDRMGHTATSDDGKTFDTGLLEQGETSEKFKLEGLIPYHCEVHPSMKGLVRSR